MKSAQQKMALEAISKWIGREVGLPGPAPTGKSAFEKARGPMLTNDGIVVMEGLLSNWALSACRDSRLVSEVKKMGFTMEPESTFAIKLVSN